VDEATAVDILTLTFARFVAQSPTMFVYLRALKIWIDGELHRYVAGWVIRLRG